MSPRPLAGLVILVGLLAVALGAVAVWTDISVARSGDGEAGTDEPSGIDRSAE